MSSDCQTHLFLDFPETLFSFLQQREENDWQKSVEGIINNGNQLISCDIHCYLSNGRIYVDIKAISSEASFFKKFPKNFSSLMLESICENMGNVMDQNRNSEIVNDGEEIIQAKRSGRRIKKTSKILESNVFSNCNKLESNEEKGKTVSQNKDNIKNSPVTRKRGRPRKRPLSESKEITVKREKDSNEPNFEEIDNVNHNDFATKEEISPDTTAVTEDSNGYSDSQTNDDQNVESLNTSLPLVVVTLPEIQTPDEKTGEEHIAGIETSVCSADLPESDEDLKSVASSLNSRAIHQNNDPIKIPKNFKYSLHIPTDQKHRCALCGKAYLLESSLTSHIRRTHGLTVDGYQKTIESGQNTEENLKIAASAPSKTGRNGGPGRRKGSTTKQSHELESLDCSRCHQIFESVKELWLHIAKHKHEDGYEAFVMETEFQIAKRKYVDPIEVNCSICQQRCMGNQVLIHMKKWHGSDPDCEYHMSKLYKKLNQTREKKMFQRNPALKARVCCEFCGKSVPRRTLSLHVKRRCSANPAGRDTGQFVCRVCHTATRSQQLLDDHMANRHPPDMRYQCELCGKEYNRLSSLVIHKRKTHNVSKNPPREHPCEVCGRVFAYPYDLKTHKLTHTDKKEAACDICGKLFKTRSHVKEHIRTQHLRRYAYRCEHCGHGVQKKKYLESHICGRVRRSQRKDDDNSTVDNTVPQANKNDSEKTSSYAKSELESADARTCLDEARVSLQTIESSEVPYSITAVNQLVEMNHVDPSVAALIDSASQACSVNARAVPLASLAHATKENQFQQQWQQVNNSSGMQMTVLEESIVTLSQGSELGEQVFTVNTDEIGHGNNVYMGQYVQMDGDRSAGFKEVKLRNIEHGRDAVTMRTVGYDIAQSESVGTIQSICSNISHEYEIQYVHAQQLPTGLVSDVATTTVQINPGHSKEQYS